MRDLIEDRFNTFAWLGQARQHPIQSNLMLKLMRAGYSPLLARAILERMPEPLAAPESMQWMMDAIERNLKTTSPTQAIHDEGGCYALVGATGVGKTTTVAKLAGLCAATHGAASVGMVTLDTRRVGAHDQLREHGRALGIVAHLAHDRAALQDLLGLLANKKMILIDTTGLVPRDPHKDESLEVLDLPGVKRLLVLNAGAHGDTLDEVVAAFKSGGIQQAVLSKIDEAVKLGPALDVAIRHQLLLRGVTTGQKVPQDWDNADARELVRQSMSTIGRSAFDPKPADLGFFFMQPDQRTQALGRMHA
jgi:flagellar biosynthesis protein FlhF